MKLFRTGVLQSNNCAANRVGHFGKAVDTFFLQRNVDSIGKVISQLRDEGACEPSDIRLMFNAST